MVTTLSVYVPQQVGRAVTPGYVQTEFITILSAKGMLVRHRRDPDRGRVVVFLRIEV